MILPTKAAKLVAEMGLAYIKALREMHYLCDDEAEEFIYEVHLATRTYDFEELARLAHQLSDNMLAAAKELEEN